MNKIVFPDVAPVRQVFSFKTAEHDLHWMQTAFLFPLCKVCISSSCTEIIIFDYDIAALVTEIYNYCFDDLVYVSLVDIYIKNFLVNSVHDVCMFHFLSLSARVQGPRAGK